MPDSNDRPVPPVPPVPSALSALSATEAAARIRDGSLRAEALVRACLDRIALREPEVGAWQHLDPDAALEAARRVDRGERGGALAGVPVGIKDIIDTADMPTTLGSPRYAGRRPGWDAACVAALRAAGAIVLGKTVTTEFAYFAPGRTRNPHRLDRTPGGSSSGSAAAVADGMVPIALGSQTAASVIRPAAFCGVIGYKASWGELPLGGIRPFAESFDSLGVLARTLGDVALVRAVLLGAAPGVPLPQAPRADRPPVVGAVRTGQWTQLEPCARDAFERACDALARAGATVRPVDLPAEFEDLIELHKTVMAWEAARNYLYETASHDARPSPQFLALTEAGWRVPRAEYVDAQRRLRACRAALGGVFDGLDVMMAPSALGEAPKASEGTGDPVMSRSWTALQLPCLAVPVGTGPSGLPVGVQLVGRAGEDAAMLSIAEWAWEALAAAAAGPRTDETGEPTRGELR